MKTTLLVFAAIFMLLIYVPGVEAQQWTFIRGDLNGDGEIAIGDPLILLNFLFLPGSATPICLDAADFDDDGLLSLIDGIDLLTYMFSNGTPPSDPFPGCGIDPTPDPLACEGPLTACPPASVGMPTNVTPTVLRSSSKAPCPSRSGRSS